MSTSTVVRDDLPSTTIAQNRTTRPVHMTTGPATLSPVDPNCQAAAFLRSTAPRTERPTCTDDTVIALTCTDDTVIALTALTTLGLSGAPVHG